MTWTKYSTFPCLSVICLHAWTVGQQNEIMFTKDLILCLAYKKQFINASYHYQVYTICHGTSSFVSQKALLVSPHRGTNGEMKLGSTYMFWMQLHPRDWTALSSAYKPGNDFFLVFPETTHDNQGH